jgi:hypothetical protein
MENSGNSAGSVQRKRRQILHENYTNSRGQNRNSNQTPNPQMYDYEIPNNNR